MDVDESDSSEDSDEEDEKSTKTPQKKVILLLYESYGKFILFHLVFCNNIILFCDHQVKDVEMVDASSGKNAVYNRHLSMFTFLFIRLSNQ